MMNIVGDRYNHLVVIEFAYRKPSGAYWKCRCDCGNITIARGSKLRNGHTKSCGCLHKRSDGSQYENHGLSNTRLYRVWNTMKQRCLNPNNSGYRRYGGRGISICDEWMNFSEFRKWAIENGYNENSAFGELTIDRINNDGNYEPTNCRLANQTTQMNNRVSNVYVEHRGVVKTIAEWARFYGVRYSTIYNRYRRGMRGDKLFAFKPDQRRGYVAVGQAESDTDADREPDD